MQTTLHLRRNPLDTQRIVAISGAIAVNAMVAMLLIAPMAAPQLLVRESEPTRYLPIPKPHRVVPPPQPVPVRQPTRHPDATPHDTRKTQATQTTTPGETMEIGDIHTDQTGETRQPPGDEDTELTGGGEIGPPVSGAHLEYASAPPPPYPREAMLDGTTGTVILQVRVGVDGKPLEVTISRSSGSRLLDAAARRQVLARWSFRPAMRDGKPIEAIGLVPVEFRLN